jgi:hypothetical protein
VEGTVNGDAHLFDKGERPLFMKGCVAFANCLRING